jgi:hypothetical protein
VRRLGGRRTCPNGHIFHVEFDPPEKEGVCDVCGAELQVRDDDKPEVIRHRLTTYRDKTEPLIDYYDSRGVLKRDMLVNVAIRAAMAKNALLIPTAAVLRDDQNLPFVFVARPGNHFARRQVTLGGRTADQYEVTAGLEPGERIVSDGALFLQFEGNQ